MWRSRKYQVELEGKSGARDVAVLMAQKLPEERNSCRPVTAVILLSAALSGPERTTAMQQEHNGNRENTAARYILGVVTLPGKAQLHKFGHPKSLAENRPRPPFPMAQYLEMAYEDYGEQCLDTQRFGEILLARLPGENWKRRKREVASIQWWRHWGNRVEELHGMSHVGDIPWIRSIDEIIYWQQLHAVMRRMRNSDIRSNACRWIVSPSTPRTTGCGLQTFGCSRTGCATVCRSVKYGTSYL